MDEFDIDRFIDKVTDTFKSLADILKDIYEQWFPYVKTVNIKSGKAPLRAKIAKHKKPRKPAMQKIKVLLLDKRTKIHRCRNHCRKYGRQIFN